MQYNLFPSADMILSMSKEYDTDAGQWEQKVAADTQVDMPTQSVHMKRRAPLDTHNREYMKQLSLRQSTDFIQVCRLKLF